MKKGDHVRILKGSLEGHAGTVERVEQSSKTVIVSVLTGQTTQYDFDEVRVIKDAQYREDLCKTLNDTL